VSEQAVPHSRILLVEDDRDLAAFMREVLTADGFDVTLAYDGRAALDALEQRRYALVVLDLMMPGMDGIEFRLRQRQHSSQWNTPALVVSAHYNIEKLAATVGAEGCLPKPFTGDDLKAAVREVLAATGSLDADTPSAGPNSGAGVKH
jgi:two-component system, OmpR family, response regulator CpxR